MLPPFTRTVLPTKRLGGAFTSYVRRRGEPDGRTANPTDKLTIDKTRKTLSRPGGGESDAAFTPSPPVVLQPETQTIALSLAHQTRIRNLYPQNEKCDALRPDSSSSASSATDWDNGHATVLRRQTQNQAPPMPPPRTKPLLDIPLAPLYNNLTQTANLENSSDSELEKIESKLFSTSQRSKMAYKKNRSSAMSTLDRLSVRTELKPAQNLALGRKLVTLPNEESLSNENLLYFSPNDSLLQDSPIKQEKEEEKTLQESKTCTTANSLHDTILATQLRHINRELTPTISEVYHERNIGLGLAPPLSKLLLNQTNQSTPQNDTNSVLEKITLGILEEDLNAELTKSNNCLKCKIDSNNCTCKSKKPWLSENASALQQIQSSDLTTADILEREVKNKKVLR